VSLESDSVKIKSTSPGRLYFDSTVIKGLTDEQRTKLTAPYSNDDDPWLELISMARAVHLDELADSLMEDYPDTPHDDCLHDILKAIALEAIALYRLDSNHLDKKEHIQSRGINKANQTKASKWDGWREQYKKRCEADPDNKRNVAGKLYDKYKKECTKSGQEPCSLSNFRKQIKK
jgi:hypothetical protein